MTALAQRLLNWVRVDVPSFLLGVFLGLVSVALRLLCLAVALYVFVLAARVSWVLSEKFTDWVF